MMKRMGTRLLSILLALLMCVQILPPSAMAALIDNDQAYNQEILDSLTEIVGSEEEASRYYAMLEHYGLLDEDGNLSQSWEIWMDGEQVTLEEIRAILDEPDCDLEKYVLVDGQAVTLGNIQTMLEIEEYIAYLRETYYDGHEWTVEQQENLQSLINQIETEGITLSTEAAEDGAVIGASGVSHTAVVSVKKAKSVLTTEGDMATNTAQIFEKALDGNPDTKWYSTAGLSRTTVQTYPVWIQVELPAPISVSKYSIVTGDDAYRRDPAHWQLQGSNNGIDWDIVDEQFDELPETRLTEVFFPLSKQATYRFFRFEVYRRRAANDDLTNGGGLQMTDLQFYAPDGNLIDLNSIYAVELSNAAPGQTVTFDWEALSGSQSVSGSGTVTMTADASGSASTAFGVNKGDVSGLNASAQPVYSVKLSNLTNALFENGRSVASLTDKTTAPISETEMNGVKEAAKGTEYALAGEGPTGGGFQTIFTLTDAQKMALRWGVLNHAALTSYTKGTLTPKNTGPTEPAIVDYTKYELLADGTRILYFEQVWNITKNTTTDTYGTKHNKATIVKRQSGASGRDPDLLTYTKLDTLAESTTFTINGTSRYEKYPIKTIYTQLAPRGITIYSSDNVTTGEGIGDGQTVACTIVFKDAVAPAVTAVSAPAGTYYPGQIVPVLVTFSEPVDAASARIKFNGGSTQYAAAEGSGYSDVLTFPYTVPEVDNATLSVSAVTVTDLGGNKLSNHNPGSGSAGQELTGVILSTPVKTNAITGMTAEMGADGGQVTVNVTVGITDVEKNTEWMVPEQDEDGRLYAKDLTVSLDGKTMYPLYFLGDSFGDGLTASIPVPLAEDTAVDYVVELYLENKLVLGRYGKATQQPPVMITEEDLSASIDLGGYTFEDPDAPIFYVQDEIKALSASIRLSGSGYAFGDTTKTAVDGTEEAEAADFVWKSGDPTVAAIDKDGKITPTGKAGTTQITLTARNGGTTGKAVTVTATYTAGRTQRDTLQFAAGLTPFLSIPNDTVTVLDGSDATVYWTSNLCDKNGETPTEFTVVVTRGETEVYRTTVSGTAAAPAGSVKLPHEKLTYDYTAAANTYTVTVSAQYEGSTYSDTAAVTLEAQPAQVTLGQLNTYCILDTSGTVSLPWSVTHLDSAGSANQNDIFRFRITRNDTEIATNVALSLSSDGSASGVFHLPIHPISAGTNDPTSYREIYTVTLQAKNGIHSTWSYDSFMLYVYDADALKIMVDGTAKTGTTMSNVSAISQMSQAQILALNRDIYLKNIISANYGEYAWTEVADQIAWKSSDSSIASVNYQQGTLYDNIEDFSYISYRPTAEFGLSGLRYGSVTVTATHRLTGMAENLNVTVETLKDKLYLFQCYPQAVTTLRYQDGTGAWKTATSDSTGAAAIYEENGIHSNVYCSASINNIGYLGTFYLSDLKTGEGDWTRLERYPCNNLTLRRAAYAYLYLKNPDGTPYTGSINFRGGVYINGTYISEARFGFSGTSVSNLGYENTSVSLNSSGKLEIHMDQTQWPGGMISAEDDVQYVFEISQLDSLTYYPLIQTVNANVNMDAYVSSGSATVAFRGNAVKEKVPFVAVQRTEFPGGGTANVLDSTGTIGPSDTSPEVALRTQVMWWDGSATDNASIRFTTESGKVLSEEKDYHAVKNNLYPFTSVPVTELVVDMNEVSLDKASVGSGVSSALNLEYYADGSQLSRRDTMSFRLLNLIGVGPVYEAESLTDMLTTMGKASDSSEKETMGTVDRFVNIAMDLVSNDDYTPGTNFALELAPTNDPSKFLGLIKVNIGNIRDANQVTGIYAPSSNPGDFDVDYMPGLNEFMVWKGKRSIYSYLGDDLNRVMKRETVRNIKGQLGGYAESLIYFDENSGKWEIQILNGGFNMGAGVTYAKHWNMQAGPVPVTISLTFGGTAEVSMDAMSVAYYNATKDETRLGNDFLTQLRVYLFLHFFAGVGFDYAVVAFKLGIFGQISLDMQFQWLNRPI